MWTLGYGKRAGYRLTSNSEISCKISIVSRAAFLSTSVGGMAMVLLQIHRQCGVEIKAKVRVKRVLEADARCLFGLALNMQRRE